MFSIPQKVNNKPNTKFKKASESPIKIDLKKILCVVLKSDNTIRIKSRNTEETTPSLRNFLGGIICRILKHF